MHAQLARKLRHGLTVPPLFYEEYGVRVLIQIIVA